jgi:manganese/zinc/iron transport system permease protein
MLLTLVQRIPDAGQAGLNRYLFGQAATLLQQDIVTMAALGGVALVMALFWKEFKLLSFDPAFGASLGFPMRALDTLLTTLIVVAIVVGLQAVGVVLMSAMIVAPAAAARQWTDRLGVMVALSALFGALSGVSGALLSSSWAVASPPARPSSSSPAPSSMVSLLLAPNRGLVARWLQRQQRNRRRLRVRAVLADLYTLASQHDDRAHAHDIAVLRTMNAGRGGVQHTLETLAGRHLVREVEPDRWALTPAGWEEAQRQRAGGGGDLP